VTDTFRATVEIGNSTGFDGSDRLSSTEIVSGSESFSGTSGFSASPFFLETQGIAESMPLNHSAEFAESNRGFNSSKGLDVSHPLSETDLFSATVPYSITDSYPPTDPYTLSGLFTPSSAIRDTARFAATHVVFGESLPFSATEERNDTHRITLPEGDTNHQTSDDSGNSTALIVVTAILMVAFIGLFAFMMYKESNRMEGGSTGEVRSGHSARVSK
jgi:hypothetical protein